MLMPLKPRGADSARGQSNGIPDGLPRSETRLWGGLEEKFTGGDSEIELSLEQFTFIRDAVQATTWPVPWARMAVTLMDAIDDLEHAL